MCGFNSGAMLWRHISCDRYLPNIKIPVMALVAKDDPITKYRFLPINEINANENFVLAVSDKGGHCEFYYSDGKMYRRFAPLVVIKFFNEI